jgi:hypothetical protein
MRRRFLRVLVALVVVAATGIVASVWLQDASISVLKAEVQFHGLSSFNRVGKIVSHVTIESRLKKLGWNVIRISRPSRKDKYHGTEEFTVRVMHSGKKYRHTFFYLVDEDDGKDRIEVGVNPPRDDNDDSIDSELNINPWVGRFIFEKDRPPWWKPNPYDRSGYDGEDLDIATRLQNDYRRCR